VIVEIVMVLLLKIIWGCWNCWSQIYWGCGCKYSNWGGFRFV